MSSASGIEAPTVQSRLWVSVFYIVALPVFGHILSAGLGIVALFWVLVAVGVILGAVVAIVRPLPPPTGRGASDASSLSVLFGGVGLSLLFRRLFAGSGWGVVLCLVGLTVACYVAGSSIHHLLRR